MAETLPQAETDVVIIGAGFSGLYAHHRLRRLGLSLTGFEAGPDVGGVWYWNRYPGARCDVESLDYCYSFSRELLDEWRWNERYATQPEILAYIEHVAQRFDLRRDIAFETRVVAATFDEVAQRWLVETNRGHRVSARFVIAASGCLSEPKAPDFAGLQDFTGQWVQTSLWPKEGVELAGRRVAMIGTGSSGIQSIPLIAQEAAHLTVFQRTPNYTLPACNAPIDPEYEAKVRADYLAHCQRNKQTKGGTQSRLATGLSVHEVAEADRAEAFERAWQFGGAGMQVLFRDLLAELPANRYVADFVAGKIRDIVKDPKTADLLTPRDYPFAAKRLCLDSDYYATFNRENVELVDISENPIERITPGGVQVAGQEYSADLIIFATGFDAMTGSLLAMNITGRGGLPLRDHWREGPANYLGLMMSGFPNLFTVNGPGSPSVLANMLVTIEHHIDWIADCIAHVLDKDMATIEPDSRSEEAWSEEVQAVGAKTLYPLARSWYMGDNVPGKPRRFLAYAGGFDNYAARCAEVVEHGYRGFVVRPPRRSIDQGDKSRGEQAHGRETTA
jgi:cyclohexanone monooxygenase